MLERHYNKPKQEVGKFVLCMLFSSCGFTVQIAPFNSSPFVLFCHGNTQISHIWVVEKDQDKKYCIYHQEILLFYQIFQQIGFINSDIWCKELLLLIQAKGNGDLVFCCSPCRMACHSWSHPSTIWVCLEFSWKFKAVFWGVFWTIDLKLQGYPWHNVPVTKHMT